MTDFTPDAPASVKPHDTTPRPDRNLALLGGVSVRVSVEVGSAAMAVEARATRAADASPR